MVTKYGMSELGPVVYGEDNDHVFLGKDLAHAKNYSDSQAKEIDNEVAAFVHEAYKLAKEILTKHKSKFESLSKELLKRESLNREEFIDLFEGKKLKKKAA